MSSYLVFFELSCLKRLRIGRLGQAVFPKGYYVYVGSGGPSRIKRYFGRIKKRHWHVDHLLVHAKVLGVRPSKIQECKVASILQKRGKVILKGFGSTDCRCISHLYFFKKISAGGKKALR